MAFFGRVKLAAGILAALVLVLAAPAGAATVSISLASDNSQCTTNGSASACAQDNDIFGADTGMDWNTSGGTSGSIAGIGSASTTLSINAVAAVDGGGDTTVEAQLDFDFDLTVTTDNPGDTWSIDIVQSALGLYAFRGDGTASAVGNQQDGSAGLSDIIVTVNGAGYNVDVVANSRIQDCSNNCETSTVFSGNRADAGVLSGTGSQTVNVSISFDAEAFSNDGCNGFICSSISGGEEAAVLFGDQSVIDQAVDEYSTWSRAVGPDGYDLDITLNILSIPEPATTTLVLGVLAALGLARRARD